MKKSILLFFLIAISLVGYGQIGKYKAMYIYNFSRLVEWPDNYRDGDFVIGIIGNSDVEDEMNVFVQNKKAGNQDISVKKFNDESDISKCNILFVARSETKNFESIMNKINGSSTLVITENEVLLEQGAAISFVLLDGKLKYYYNGVNAQKHGLKVSTSLENMAIASK